MIRSTANDSGAIAATEIDVNVTAFDALVTSTNGRAFDFVVLDYHTDVPLRGRQAIGHAIVLAKAAVDVERGKVMERGSVADIAPILTTLARLSLGRPRALRA